MNRVQHSDFWNDSRNSQLLIDSFLDSDNTPTKPKKDLVKLASYKKAISNFVNIIAKKSVKVTFKGTESYTDGKTVTLSGNIDEKNFDYNCGLAMHEGSHIVYSKFLGMGDYADLAESLVGRKWLDSTVEDEFIATVKQLTNYFEDRRIDNIVYKSSPGYRGYYKALYDKYFNTKTINKALKTKIYAQQTTTANYIFYIANMTNQFCDSNDLPGLKKIFKTINLNNIDRLQDTVAAAKLAVVVTKQIFDIVDKAQEEDKKNNPRPEGEYDDKDGRNFEDRREFRPSANAKSNDEAEYSERQQKLIDSAAQKQKDFIEGKTKKSGLTKRDTKMMNSLANAGATKQEVEVDNEYGRKDKLEVLVLNKLTEDILDAQTASFLTRWPQNEEEIAEGMRLGTMLGRKLQIRNEEQTLKTTRQSKGKIDKRLISELGFDNTNVFQQMYTNRFKDVNIHISVDASGSMSGRKYRATVKSVVAICKAASMTKNISVQVTYRSTVMRGNEAVVGVVYNSKVDSLTHLQKWMKHLRAGGLTPEGLCFAAVNKLIQDTKAETNLFVNYSDGMPYCDNYYGRTAIRHTQKEVDKLRYSGYKVMSFFITDDYEGDKEKRDFQTMYGKGATFINPTNMMMVAKQLNNVFLGR